MKKKKTEQWVRCIDRYRDEGGRERERDGDGGKELAQMTVLWRQASLKD